MPDLSGSPRVVSHQTVILSAGRHSSPAEGACVMELASMLAGEVFSDEPQSVCPVIAAFLRAYNDRLEDDRRQDLYRYAAKVVGTRATDEIGELRARMCRKWAARLDRRRLRDEPPLGPPPPSTPPAILELLWLNDPTRAGHRAAVAVSEYGPDDTLHRAALRFVDRLIAVNSEPDAALGDQCLPDISASCRSFA